MKEMSRGRSLMLLAAVAVMAAGCGGVRGTYQASPASLMLLKAAPAPSPSPAAGGHIPVIVTAD